MNSNNAEVQRYYHYYNAQSHGNTLGNFYTSQRGQKGAGLGSFLAQVFRKVFPFIKSGASALGKELLQSGIGVFQDNFKGIPLKESVKGRMTEAGNNLTRRAANKVESMMTGNGVKKRRKRRSNQSAGGTRRKRIAKRKTKPKRKSVSKKKKKKPVKKGRVTKKKSQKGKKDIFG
jgi:hypothetical protein